MLETMNPKRVTISLVVYFPESLRSSVLQLTKTKCPSTHCTCM